MATDYTKFKTPYFDIEIGDPKWETRIKLPEYLLRLVTKVELTEAFYTSDSPGATTLTLSFVEGFTKEPGFLTDLIFDGRGGLSSLTEEGKKKAKAVPKFLFQEKNKVKLTWGYLEDKENSRSYMGYITIATTNFPETGIPTTTITCTPFSATMGDQLSTKKGRGFATKTTLSKGGDSLLVFEDLKTDDLIRKAAKDLKLGVIISENLTQATIDKHKQKMWVSGQSFQQLMTRLADASGCTYGIETDPKTGKDTIIFVSKKDFEKRVVLSDLNLLHWKQPGSILKSVNVNADFGGLTGNDQKGFDADGKPIENDPKTKEQLLVERKSSTTGKKQQIVDPNPLSGNVVPTAGALDSTFANGGTVGTAEYNPAQSKQDHTEKSVVRAAGQLQLIQLDFTTIGYTRLTPGIVEISGIGTRYSGKYRVMSVTHTIDSNGYITKCQATSHSLAIGGVVPENMSKTQEADKKSDEQLMVKAKSDPLAQIMKFKGLSNV